MEVIMTMRMILMIRGWSRWWTNAVFSLLLPRLSPERDCLCYPWSRWKHVKTKRLAGMCGCDVVVIADSVVLAAEVVVVAAAKTKQKVVFFCFCNWRCWKEKEKNRTDEEWRVVFFSMPHPSPLLHSLNFIMWENRFAPISMYAAVQNHYWFQIKPMQKRDERAWVTNLVSRKKCALTKISKVSRYVKICQESC